MDIGNLGNNDILPETGLWDLPSLARYLKMQPDSLQRALKGAGVKVLVLGQDFSRRVVSLSAVAEYFKAGK